MLLPAQRSEKESRWKGMRNILAQLRDMGYEYDQAEQAVYRTGARGVPDAIEWLETSAIALDEEEAVD